MGDDIETVPETEMYGESVDRMSNVEDDVTETVGATQPPTPAQMPTLLPIPFRDTPPDLGAPYPSQQFFAGHTWNYVATLETGLCKMRSSMYVQHPGTLHMHRLFTIETILVTKIG